MGGITTNKQLSRLGLVVLVAAGMAARVAGAAPEEAPKPGFAWKNGAEVYAKICALCHETAVGPTLRGRGLDPTYIQFIVRHGNRAMPAFRASEIDDQSLEKLAEYLSKAEANK
ncbi:MAG: cytochrome c [Nitrospirales bacterium]|nr:cytochrome c [Nitrospirales bacterium]QOJ35420.1 MAG: cytochrome c [Nitrospira sp.]